jgi:hypothetical protein
LVQIAGEGVTFADGMLVAVRWYGSEDFPGPDVDPGSVGLKDGLLGCLAIPLASFEMDGLWFASFLMIGFMIGLMIGWLGCFRHRVLSSQAKGQAAQNKEVLF